jgi:hypothetical protein
VHGRTAQPDFGRKRLDPCKSGIRQKIAHVISLLCIPQTLRHIPLIAYKSDAQPIRILRHLTVRLHTSISALNISHPTASKGFLSPFHTRVPDSAQSHTRARSFYHFMLKDAIRKTFFGASFSIQILANFDFFLSKTDKAKFVLSFFGQYPQFSLLFTPKQAILTVHQRI